MGGEREAAVLLQKSFEEAGLLENFWGLSALR